MLIEGWFCNWRYLNNCIVRSDLSDSRRGRHKKSIPSACSPIVLLDCGKLCAGVKNNPIKNDVTLEASRERYFYIASTLQHVNFKQLFSTIYCWCLQMLVLTFLMFDHHQSPIVLNDLFAIPLCFFSHIIPSFILIIWNNSTSTSVLVSSSFTFFVYIRAFSKTYNRFSNVLPSSMFVIYLWWYKNIIKLRFDKRLIRAIFLNALHGRPLNLRNSFGTSREFPHKLAGMPGLQLIKSIKWIGLARKLGSLSFVSTFPSVCY